MKADAIIALPYEDYAQSANTLFHFMSKMDYLTTILRHKAIVPRYCLEDIEYLNIHIEGTIFNEVAVLQKCFCDIPFHKLTEFFELNGFGEAYNALSDEDKNNLKRTNTHPDYYGKFAIAFSKGWGERKNLQPVHYLNVDSSYVREFSELMGKALSADDIPDEHVNDILNRLSFMKPLRGVMKRTIHGKDSKTKTIEFIKNFHDEKEWRYVPNAFELSKTSLRGIIANPHMLKTRHTLNSLNDTITEEKYRPLWIEYNYDDIRYIIVPDSHARIIAINTILQIPDENFNQHEEIALQKHILMTKIQVLDEIRKDW